jgi:hypothetical protein
MRACLLTPCSCAVSVWCATESRDRGLEGARAAGRGPRGLPRVRAGTLEEKGHRGQRPAGVPRLRGQRHFPSRPPTRLHCLPRTHTPRPLRFFLGPHLGPRSVLVTFLCTLANRRAHREGTGTATSTSSWTRAPITSRGTRPRPRASSRPSPSSSSLSTSRTRPSSVRLSPSARWIAHSAACALFDDGVLFLHAQTVGVSRPSSSRIDPSPRRAYSSRN